MLELVEEALDAIAFGIEGKVAGARIFDMRTWRNDGLSAGSFYGIDDFLTVVAFVGNDVLCRKINQQRFALRIVGCLSRRQDEPQGIAQGINGRVNFCRQSAP